MKELSLFQFIIMFALLGLISACNNTQQNQAQIGDGTIADPLPSWNEGETKQAIIDFVTKTTTEGNADFIKISDRIACFDNDGCLWSEQPMYFQLAFAIDRVKALSPREIAFKNSVLNLGNYHPRQRLVF